MIVKSNWLGNVFETMRVMFVVIGKNQFNFAIGYQFSRNKLHAVYFAGGAEIQSPINCRFVPMNQ